MEVYDLDLLIWLEGILTLEFIWKPLRIHLEYRVCPVPPPPTPFSKFFFLLCTHARLRAYFGTLCLYYFFFLERKRGLPFFFFIFYLMSLYNIFKKIIKKKWKGKVFINFFIFIVCSLFLLELLIFNSIIYFPLVFPLLF